MTEREMWNAYINLHAEAASFGYEAWAYGDAPDYLARLTVDGVKTATTSALAIYEIAKEPMPKAGDYSVVLWEDGSAVCVIRTTRVYVVPYRDVSAEHAYKEGEGDRSLFYWRKVHETFFSRELETVGLKFSEDMEVVCEEFAVVFT